MKSDDREAKAGQSGGPDNEPPGGMPSVTGLDVTAAFKEAMKLHQAGHLGEAEKICRSVLEAHPDHFGSVHLLGVIDSQRGDHEAALRNFDAALGIRASAAAFFNRGNALKSLKRLDEALDSYDRAIALTPDYAQAFNNRGNVLKELKRLDEALESYDRAVALKPDHVQAFFNRGIALSEMKRLDEAVASFDKAIALKQDHTEAFFHRGNALMELHRLDEALSSYDRAIELVPKHAEALVNRGIVLSELKRWDEALASYERSIELRPYYAQAFNNRGIALKELKRLGEALASYDRAIALKPDYAEAFNNRAIAGLLAGRYATGWADYEWRWKTKGFPGKKPRIDAKDWQGEDIAGRRIAIYTEQGLGDIIQFARYLPLVVRRGAKVTLHAPVQLRRLLQPLTANIELDDLFRSRATFDFQCALMSLPRWLASEASPIPNEVPYLKAEPEIEAAWKKRIGTHGFKIGIAWQGNKDNKLDQGRSFPLSGLFPLAQVPGVRLIGLQKNHGLDQLSNLPSGMAVEILGDSFDAGPDAFIDTAAVMANLDLIVTPDTSIAHLAGALARPAWVALKFVPDWRWLLDRADSPWYPALRLFRQETDGDWKGVFSRMGQELQSLLAGKDATPAPDSTNVPPAPKVEAAAPAAWELSAEQAFADTYRFSIWGRNAQGTGTSGSGSTIRATPVYRTFLQEFLKNNDIRSVVDAGCGDWGFSQAIDWSGIDYKGFDIVEAVIDADKERFAKPNIQFFAGNFVEMVLPPADLLICKHVLQHLPTRDVLKFLAQLPKYKHVLLTNSVSAKTMSGTNEDIDAGGFRALDPTIAPFNLKGMKILTYWDGRHMHQVVHIAPGT